MLLKLLQHLQASDLDHKLELISFYSKMHPVNIH